MATLVRVARVYTRGRSRMKLVSRIGLFLTVLLMASACGGGLYYLHRFTFRR